MSDLRTQILQAYHSGVRAKNHGWSSTSPFYGSRVQDVAFACGYEGVKFDAMAERVRRECFPTDEEIVQDAAKEAVDHIAELAGD